MVKHSIVQSKIFDLERSSSVLLPKLFEMCMSKVTHVGFDLRPLFKFIVLFWLSLIYSDSSSFFSSSVAPYE